MEVKFSKTLPPVYFECKRKFNVTWDKGIVITYGDTIHSKFGSNIPPDLCEHEATHVEQQTKMGKELWWKKYLVDKDFRLSQELAAYRRQLEYARIYYKPKSYVQLFDKCVHDLAKIYGGMVTLEESEKLLSTSKADIMFKSFQTKL